MGSDKNIDLGELSYEDALFMLKIISNHLFGILDAAFSGSINVTDQPLNERYIYLRGLFDSILNRKDFETLNQKRITNLPDHIFNDIEATHVWWTEEGETKFMSFLGEIEIFFIDNGQRVPALMPSGIIDFFNRTEADIIKHKENKAAKWNKIQANTKPTKITLVGKKISFEENSSEITIDGKSIQIPANTNSHDLCRVIFKRERNTPVSWDELFIEITGTTEPKDTNKDKRMVRDAMYKVNNIIKEQLPTDEELLVWRSKTITLKS